MSKILENARNIRKIVLKNIKSFSDQDISQISGILDKLKEDGSLIPVGTRINWKGIAKKAVVDLWDTVENNPDSAPTLWEDLPYKNGVRIIPETITAASIFQMGELGYWGETLYKSLINNNSWTPEEYPAGWEIIEV